MHIFECSILPWAHMLSGTGAGDCKAFCDMQPCGSTAGLGGDYKFFTPPVRSIERGSNGGLCLVGPGTDLILWDVKLKPKLAGCTPKVWFEVWFAEVEGLPPPQACRKG